MVPNTLLINSGLSREQYYAIIALENAQNHQNIFLQDGQKLEKTLMVIPWFFIQIGPRKMVANRLLIHLGLFREQYHAILDLENA